MLVILKAQCRASDSLKSTPALLIGEVLRLPIPAFPDFVLMNDGAIYATLSLAIHCGNTQSYNWTFKSNNNLKKESTCAHIHSPYAQ